MTITSGRPRLPQPSAPPSRSPEVVRGLLSATALLAVVVGVPLLLASFVGWPLPTSAPDRSWLTSAIDAATLMKVIACAVWLAWAHFTVCVVVEVRAEVRGQGLQRRVPLGGGSQSIARRLVGAVLLLVTSATVVAPAASALAQTAPTGRLAATATVQAHTRQVPVALAAPSSAAEQGTVTKLYDVKPPEGRHYECLWDIAEKYLGSGLRYKELVQLNQGRLQPDGRTLKDPDLIHPGWVLVMPVDASGLGLRVVDRVPSPGTAAPAVAKVSGATQLRPGAVPSAKTSDAGTAAQAADSALATVAPFGLAGATLAAGLLVALRRRRGALGVPDEDLEPEVDLRLAADVPLAQRVDRALRDLSQRLTAADREIPPVYAAWLQGGAITLALSPAVPDAPAPWTADAAGRTWTLSDTADIVSVEELDGVSAPYPGLVTLGVQERRGSVLLDLESAGGVISLGGDAVVAREVAASVAVELATNLWSDEVQVTLVGFGDDLTAIAPDRLARVDDLDQVLDVVERDTARQAATCAAQGLSGVLRGRQVRADRGLWRPQFLVLSAAPTSAQATRLTGLAADGRRGVGVLVVGDVPTARWRMVLTPAGTLHATALGLDLAAQRLTVEQYGPVVRMLAASDARPAVTDDEIVGFVREQASAVLVDESMADAARSFPVEVRVLGPLEVRAPGRIDDARRELASEVVVLAALHPEGLHPNVLASAIWPRGASEQVQTGALAHVQQWLGDDDSGRPRLARGSDGLWRLADDVRVDWRVVQALVARAAGPREAGDLAAALAFVRGAAWTDLPAGRYAWLARNRAERSSRLTVVSAAHRLAAIAVARADVALARQALQLGLRMVPTAELLWRDLIRLEHDSGGPQAAGSVAREAYCVLGAQGVPGGSDAETDALVDELAPGVRRQVA